MERKVKIEKAQNGLTKLWFNSVDISAYISSFSLSQMAHNSIPTLTITLPISAVEMPSDFWAALEIKKNNEGME